MRVFRDKTKALVLLLITPFLLTELLTGNIGFPYILDPATFITLIIVYGFPILIIRELVVRWQGGALSIFLLGLTYGLFNEGIIAKTLMMQQALPIPIMDGYGYILGISIPFTLLIVPWHALYSVMFPISKINGMNNMPKYVFM